MAVIADVFDMVFLDNKGDVVATDTLVDANIEVTVTQNDVRGGKGNQLLGVLHADRDINITTNDASFRYEFLAKQFGADIKTGAGVAYAMPRWYQVEDDGTATYITLEHVPLSEDELQIYNEEGQKITGFTLKENEVEFVGATPSVEPGESVEVRTYTYQTTPETQEFEIDNKVFAKGGKLILETIEVDPSTEEVLAKIQYEFFNAIPTGEITVSTASERTAQSQPFNLRIVKPKTSSVVGVVKRIPVKE